MKGLILISGGLDSPVAAYLMLKKGVDIIALNMDNRPLADDASSEKVKKVVKKLSELTGRKIPLYMVNHGKSQQEIIANCDSRMTCILCKRIMFRIAEKIALAEACDFIITGDNLGQVASQTMDNMRTITSSVKIPVIRPLLCNDKNDTIKIAKEIGMYDLLAAQTVGCKAVPAHPATVSYEDRIAREESKIDIDRLIENAIKTKVII